MKLLAYLIFLFLIPLAIALEECKPIIQVSELPCQITSTWNYTQPCNSHQANVYNLSGENIINFTLGDLGNTGLCNFIWNISEKGSYLFAVDTLDTGNIIVEAKDDMAVFSIILFLMAINIGIFICPLFFRLNDAIKDYTVKRGVIIFGLMFLGFNIFILYLVASEYLTILKDEMLFLFEFSETSLFLTIFTMMCFALINRVKMIREKKKQISMGEE